MLRDMVLTSLPAPVGCYGSEGRERERKEGEDTEERQVWISKHNSEKI